ncbi:MAG TPA: type VI secretion system tube protein Hcp [Terriglobales bacterium]
MPSDYYVLLDQIKGESQAQDMQDYIEVDSFSFGASSPADIGGKGLSAGKVSVSDFSFTCPLDSSSPSILNDLYSGKPIATVTFKGRKSGGGGEPYVYLTVTMKNCFVTSHSTGGGSTGVPLQSVSLAYEQIQYEYSTQDSSSGQVQNAGSSTYNVSQVKQS